MEGKKKEKSPYPIQLKRFQNQQPATFQSFREFVELAPLSPLLTETGNGFIGVGL